ncbi:MAG: ABC-2 transporter permease [Oscillospiraceae bacterium]|jgi:hypothetical protein|nr:ABC-2 transporter permease [Oscillospiraceae bacterium]
MSAIKMLKLDFLSVRAYIKSYILFLIYPFLFFDMGVIGIGAMCGVMFTFLAATVFSLQEKNRMERLYSAVAMPERGVVRGRYLFLAAHALTVCLVIIPLTILASRFTGRETSPAQALLAMGVAFVLFWLTAGLQAPLFFRYGYTKMRMITYAPILVIMMVPFIVFNYVVSDNTRAAISERASAIADRVSGAELAVIFFALGIIFMLVSYLCAVRGYRGAKG